MDKKEPRLEWTDLLGGLCVYIGLLLFLVCLHILTISSTGDIFEVLNGVFQWALYLYLGLAVFGVGGLIIQLLRWLVWTMTIPYWQRKKSRDERLR